MVKTIHFKVSDDLYYKLVALKAQTRTDSWVALMEHITQPKQPLYPEQTVGVKPSVPNKRIGSALCVCGHPEGAHDADGCLGNGCECDCKGYRRAEAQSKEGE